MTNKLCPGCGVSHRSVCDTCVAKFAGDRQFFNLDGTEQLTVLGPYVAELRSAVLSAKNYRPDLLPKLAQLVAQKLSMKATTELTISWIPASKSGRRTRGFDQSQILASHVAKELNVRAIRTLRRSGADRQIGKGRFERLYGPNFRVIREVSGVCLLVDDVVTTGSSMQSAASLLRQSGAEVVYGAALAAVEIPSTASARGSLAV